MVFTRDRGSLESHNLAFDFTIRVDYIYIRDNEIRDNELFWFFGTILSFQTFSNMTRESYHS